MRNMMNRNKARGVMLALTTLVFTSCGGVGGGIFKKKISNGDSSSGSEAPKSSETSTNSGNSEGDTDLTSLTVLSPAEMADKIYRAFGRNMTITKSGNADVDYLQVNANNFTGSISGDPNNRIASQASIGFFLALAGLSDVVGKNYNTGLFSGASTNDCRKESGARSIILAIAPSINQDDFKKITADLVVTCATDPAAGASAVVQSYSFAVKK